MRTLVDGSLRAGFLVRFCPLVVDLELDTRIVIP